MSFIKKCFICKEKSGTVTKVKLVTKIKWHNHHYFGTLVLASYCHSQIVNRTVIPLFHIRVTINFYAKQCLPVIHSHQK